MTEIPRRQGAVKSNNAYVEIFGIFPHGRHGDMLI